MSWSMRIRSNLAWALLVAVIINEKDSPRKLALILGMAAIFALGNSLLDAANVRLSTPLRWPRRRRGQDSGAA